jgi:hypothetical protein
LGAGGPTNTVLENGVFLLGAAGVVISAAIHLHLWDTGYSDIKTIGPLFLAQSIVGFCLAAMLIILRRLWVAALCFGYLLSTITGFLLSVNVGLFGFQDTWSAPFASAAFWDEFGACVLLLTGGALCAVDALS